MKTKFNPAIWLVKRRMFNPSQWLLEPVQNKQVAHRFNIKPKNDVQHDVEVVIGRIERQKIDLTMDRGDWVKLAFIFSSSFGEFGRSYYQRVCQFWPGYDLNDCDNQFDKCLKRKKYENIKSFFAMARDAGVNIRV